MSECTQDTQEGRLVGKTGLTQVIMLQSSLMLTFSVSAETADTVNTFSCFVIRLGKKVVDYTILQNPEIKLHMRQITRLIYQKPSHPLIVFSLCLIFTLLPAIQLIAHVCQSKEAEEDNLRESEMCWVL